MSSTYPAEPCRWAILGPGRIAAKFAEAVHRTGDVLTAVGSRDLERARHFAVEHGVGTAHGSYEQLVADPTVEAVYIATTNDRHAEHAHLALEAGKHVLVEKPATTTKADLRRLVQLAALRGLFFMEGLWSLHLPVISWTRDQIRTGRLGHVVSLRADHGQHLDVGPDHRVMDPALGGGALLDLGVYPIALAIDLLGEPTQVRATQALTETGVDGHTGLHLIHANGAMSSLSTTLWARTGTTAEVCGTEAILELSGPFYTTASAGRLTSADRDRRVLKEFPATGGNGFEHQLLEARRCIRTGVTESPMVPWSTSLAVQAVAERARTSAAACAD